jgi:ribonuclease P protein component
VVTDRGLHEGLGRGNRLRKRSGFLAVQQGGRRVSGRTMVVYAMPQADGKNGNVPRLGVTVSKKVGKAVMRNRVKRWVREGYRRMLDARLKGTDVVVIAKPAAASSSYQATTEEMRGLLRRVLGS